MGWDFPSWCLGGGDSNSDDGRGHKGDGGVKGRKVGAKFRLGGGSKMKNIRGGIVRVG